MEHKAEITFRENETRVLIFSSESAKFNDGDFKGELYLSASTMLVNLESGKQYQIDTVEILKAIKKAIKGAGYESTDPVKASVPVVNDAVEFAEWLSAKLQTHLSISGITSGKYKWRLLTGADFSYLEKTTEELYEIFKQTKG